MCIIGKNKHFTTHYTDLCAVCKYNANNESFSVCWKYVCSAKFTTTPSLSVCVTQCAYTSFQNFSKHISLTVDLQLSKLFIFLVECAMHCTCGDRQLAQYAAWGELAPRENHPQKVNFTKLEANRTDQEHRGQNCIKYFCLFIVVAFLIPNHPWAKT